MGCQKLLIFSMMKLKNELKIAWCVEAATVDYLIGCLRLAQRMRHLKSKYPVIVLVNSSIGDEYLIDLKSSNINVCKVDMGDFLAISRNTSASFESLKMMDYDFICNLEADMIPKVNMDSYLDCHINLYYEPEDVFLHRYHTGVMFIKPNINTYDKIYNEIQMEGRCEIVESFFENWHDNCKKTIVDDLINYNGLDDFPEQILHFPSTLKPWNDKFEFCGNYIKSYVLLGDLNFNKFFDNTIDWWELYSKMAFLFGAFNKSVSDSSFYVGIMGAIMDLGSLVVKTEHSKNKKLEDTSWYPKK